jgi:hypothetical protein
MSVLHKQHNNVSTTANDTIKAYAERVMTVKAAKLACTVALVAWGAWLTGVTLMVIVAGSLSAWPSLACSRHKQDKEVSGQRDMATTAADGRNSLCRR